MATKPDVELVAVTKRFGETAAVDSVSLAIMPIFHIAGAGWSMIGLYFGCRTVVLRELDPGPPRVRADFEAVPADVRQHRDCDRQRPGQPVGALGADHR